VFDEHAAERQTPNAEPSATPACMADTLMPTLASASDDAPRIR